MERFRTRDRGGGALAKGRSMAELKTDEALLRRLRQAASAPLTAEELRRQRVSFIMGSVGDESNVTREYVESYLDAQEGRKRA